MYYINPDCAMNVHRWIDKEADCYCYLPKDHDGFHYCDCGRCWPW